MTRIERLLNGVGKSDKILEIGPGYNPVAPKSAGWNTHVVDHSSRDELRAKYAGAPVDIDAFEEVDTIWHEGPLHDVIPSHLHGTFDILIASHVAEHIPDFAGFLVSAGRLLKPEGVVSLAIPDRRFCFDYFKPDSTTGDVLEAFVARRARHSIRAIWNHKAYAVRMDGLEAWGQHAVTEAGFLGPFREAAAAFRSYDESASYTDCHAWQFTPAGFRLILLELNNLGITDWQIEQLHGPEGCEFLVTLRRTPTIRRSPDALQSQRLGLLRDRLVELREQVDFAIAGGAVPAGGESSAAMTTRIAQRVNAQDTRLAELDGRLLGLARSVEVHDQRLGGVEAVIGRLLRAIQPLRVLWRPFRSAGL